jgi:hypothetical protein
VRTSYGEEVSSYDRAIFESRDPQGIRFMLKDQNVKEVRWVTIPVLACWAYYFLSKPCPTNFLVFEPAAASRVVIMRKEKGEGVLVFDIGHQSVGCIFWEDHMVKAAFGMTMSASQVTRNIAYREGISTSEAMSLQSSAVDSEGPRLGISGLNSYSLEEHAREFARIYRRGIDI